MIEFNLTFQTTTWGGGGGGEGKDYHIGGTAMLVGNFENKPKRYVYQCFVGVARIF